MPSRSLPIPQPDILAPVDRWTPHRKQRLIDAIAAGTVDRDVALARHGISIEEFNRWVAMSGARGLRAPVRFHAGASVVLATGRPKHARTRGLI